MVRLDQELVARGMARSRTHAAALIAQGRVLHNGNRTEKAAQKILPGEALEVRDNGVIEYVSRAGQKLSGALAAFPDASPSGLRCLDAGASTGGFTDVLLRNGAAWVAAVDVGHGQLDDSLRADPRVSAYEGLNVRALEPRMIGGPVGLTVADLSFISLTMVMEPLARATSAGGSLILMVKPQFEVGRVRLPSTGVVSREDDRRWAVENVLVHALAAGLVPGGLVRSPLPGQYGNAEFFLWLRVPLSAVHPRIGDESAAAAKYVAESFVFATSP